MVAEQVTDEGYVDQIVSRLATTIIPWYQEHKLKFTTILGTRHFKNNICLNFKPNIPVDIYFAQELRVSTEHK